MDNFIQKLFSLFDVIKQLLRERLYFAFMTLTIPHQKEWILLFLLFIVLLLTIGFISGFLKIKIINENLRTVFGLILVSFITPSLGEELFFRVLLLPHPYENASLKIQVICTVISIVAFIIYHPIQGLLWNSAGFHLFTQPIFLVLATFLGLICTISYLATGSVWISSLIHWLIVITWLTILDGFAKFPRI